jgi:hypothetical protein
MWLLLKSLPGDNVEVHLILVFVSSRIVNSLLDRHWLDWWNNLCEWILLHLLERL